MSIVLSPDVERQIEELVRGGRFPSADECIRTCIAVLCESDKEQRERMTEMRKHGEEVRKLVAEGRAALERGEYEVFNNVTLKELSEQIKVEGRQLRRLPAAS